MRHTRFGIRLAALGATIALAGCAPGFGGVGFGPGIRLGITPDLRLNLAPASCLLLGTSLSPGVALNAGAAAQAGMRRQQVAAVQAAAMLGAGDLPTQTESWKRLATGGC